VDLNCVGGRRRLTLEAIARKRRALDAAEAEWLSMVATYDRAETWRADGFGSAAAALATECHLSLARLTKRTKGRLAPENEVATPQAKVVKLTDL
jgi:plasmid maintenance system antidote protein VapI